MNHLNVRTSKAFLEAARKELCIPLQAELANMLPDQRLLLCFDFGKTYLMVGDSAKARHAANVRFGKEKRSAEHFSRDDLCILWMVPNRRFKDLASIGKHAPELLVKIRQRELSFTDAAFIFKRNRRGSIKA